MSAAELVQIAFFRPVIERLAEAGVPVAEHLRNCRLDRFDIDDSESVIPVNLQYRFFERIADREGLPNLAVEMGEAFRLARIGKWGQAVAACPDLLTACLGAQDHVNSLESHCDLRLEIRGARSLVRCSYRYPPCLGRRQSEYLSLLLMLDTFRLAGGPGCAPLEIHLPGRSLEGLHDILPTDRISPAWPSSFRPRC